MDAAPSAENALMLPEKFNALPPWLKKEYRALASILRFPKELDLTYGDVQSELSFGPGTSAMACFILARYMRNGEVPEAPLVEKQVRAIFQAKDAERYLRLLQIAPTFCPYHVAHDLTWFAHERRFWRRLSDAFEDLREQHFSWKEFQTYLLRAADLDDLQHDACFTRLLALLCRSLLNRFSKDRPPEPCRASLGWKIRSPRGRSIKSPSSNFWLGRRTAIHL